MYVYQKSHKNVHNNISFFWWKVQIQKQKRKTVIQSYNEMKLNSERSKLGYLFQNDNAQLQWSKKKWEKKNFLSFIIT